MEEAMKSSEQKNMLFNSPLETGIRAVVLLNACYPKAFDLTHLVWLDYLVVHTEDIGGPPSLHPALPHRSGELAVRRRLIDEGILLMRRVRLISHLADSEGIMYEASDDAPAFVELLGSSYVQELKDRAHWIAAYVCSLSSTEISGLIRECVGRWSVEFQGEADPD
jgi:hypothetical protein